MGNIKVYVKEVRKNEIKMIVKCFVEDCIYNTENFCTKDEIEIYTISAYDTDSAECLDYEKK